ncbi:ribosomal-protein-serine acetyltransferase [Scopulibacillus daqui]|uniref:Ribosomal-protein-serine acetyltransferase n=1 Tax=Scopulibacillus daqui TaxID=1469162 RepID=A0ABS2PZE5_9BACL|nr:GNAT family protein [Scopulibacillus daqui]MBM7645410.1 ribosomal-protein-serine acetyltransferase [Scopulibacillus daqui]
MFTFKVDEQIELRLLEDNDAEPLFALVDKQRSYLREWLPWVDGVTSAANYSSTIKMWRKQFADNDGFQAGILYQQELCGMVGFHSYHWANRSTSIGYWLSKDFQGKGIMTRACQAIIRYAFSSLHMNRIEIRCAEENHKSRAIPERLGFKKEGTVRDGEFLYDHFVNTIIYSLLKEDWKKLQQKS